MRAFVTGATGFIGSHVCRELRDRGHEVRALVRESSDLTLLEDLTVETHVGDVTDPVSLREGLEDCEAFFHLAGVVSFWKGKAELMHEVNVEGAYNAVEAAKAADVERMVHTSSVAALGIPEGRVGDEETEFDWGGRGIPYKETKHRGQEIVLQNARNGLVDAVSVNPGTVLGPGDKNLNGGQFVRAMVKGDMPGLPGGGVTFVDVRDVARGHVQAYEEGATGERYVLGGDNLSWSEFSDVVADVTGADTLDRVIPYPLALAVGYANNAKAKFTGKPPLLSAGAVKAAYNDLYFSSAKAEKELGYEHRPARESVEDTYEWYVEHGYLDPVEEHQ
jgi:dihydroflavonol-4-reductase